MKKIRFLLILALVLFTIPAWPAWATPPVPVVGQAACSGTAAQIWAGGNGALSGQYYRLIIVPITAGVTVWVAPISTITSGSGIPLSTTGLTSYIIDGNPNEPWYCITSGASANVNYIVLW